jgi:hypothetical protein
MGAVAGAGTTSRCYNICQYKLLSIEPVYLRFEVYPPEHLSHFGFLGIRCCPVSNCEELTNKESCSEMTYRKRQLLLSQGLFFLFGLWYG